MYFILFVHLVTVFSLHLAYLEFLLREIMLEIMIEQLSLSQNYLKKLFWKLHCDHKPLTEGSEL